MFRSMFATFGCEFALLLTSFNRRCQILERFDGLASVSSVTSSVFFFVKSEPSLAVRDVASASFLDGRGRFGPPFVLTCGGLL